MNNQEWNYSELRAHYIAVRQRLGGLGKPAGLVPLQAVKLIPQQISEPEAVEIKELETIWTVKGLPHNNFTRFLMEVAKKHDLDPHMIIANDRRKNIVMARREVIYGAFKNLNYSQSQIARWLKRDHTSISHAVQMWEKQNNVGA